MFVQWYKTNDKKIVTETGCLCTCKLDVVTFVYSKQVTCELKVEKLPKIK